MKKVILVFSIVLFHCKYKDSTNILMTTEIGTITIELLPNVTPITVKIFYDMLKKIVIVISPLTEM